MPVRALLRRDGILLHITTEPAEPQAQAGLPHRVDRG